MSDAHRTSSIRLAARWMAAGFLAAAACVAGLALAGVVRLGPAPRPVLTYAFTPRRVTFFTGDTIFVQPTSPGADRLGPDVQFRVMVKPPSTRKWTPGGEYSRAWPRYTLTEPGLYDLQLDEKIRGNVRSVYLGQAIVAAADQRPRITRLLRQVIARHFDPTRFSSSDVALNRQATDEFYAAVSHEALIVLLVMYHQHLGLPADAWDGLIESMSFTGLHVQEAAAPRGAGGGLCTVISPAIGAVEVDLAGRLIRSRGQPISCDLADQPVLRDVFDTMAGRPAPQVIAAAITCMLHGHLVYGPVPEQTFGQWVPSVVQNLGHCGSYQSALHELLRALNYHTRSVNVVYRSGGIHAFNEVAFDESGQWRIFTLDATASIMFAGSLCELTGRPPIIELPTPTNLPQMLWINEKTAIAPELVEKAFIPCASHWPEESVPFCSQGEIIHSD